MISAKCRFFSSVIFWVLFSFGSVWAGIIAFEETFSFGARIVFSPYELFLPLAPIILMFPCVYWFMALRYGEELATKKLKRTNKILIGFLIVYALLAIVFVIFYKTYLNGQGYLICSGRPRGWIIGMATEYVKALSDCIK